MMTSEKRSSLQKTGRLSKTRNSNSKRSSSLFSRQNSAFAETEEQFKMRVVNEFMGELTERTMEKIFEIYMEKQTMKFVVHCTHKAYEKLIETYFFTHPKYMNVYEPLWVPDAPVSPSPADSWAVHQATCCKTNPDKRLNTMEDILELMEKFKAQSSRSQLLLESLQSEQEPEEEVQEEEEQEDDDEMSEQFSVTNIMNWILNRIELPEELKPQKSVFTNISTGYSHYFPYEVQVRDRESKLTCHQKWRLPSIKLPDSADSRKTIPKRSDSTITHLPPIRSCAQFKARRGKEDVDETQQNTPDVG